MSDSSSIQTARELAAGSFGGVVQVLAGQPFDTIKVRMQSGGNAYRGTMDCVKRTVGEEGVGALYKGTLSPLAGVAFCVSIQFGVLAQAKRALQAMNAREGAETGLSILQYFHAGSIAGVANSIVSGPVEHIRIRMQVQQGAQYASTLDCFKQIMRTYGLRGIYHGQVPTVMREWLGYGAYFGMYETLVQRATRDSGMRVQDLPSWKVMLSGGAAGYAMWLPVYPIDMIKSRIQTDSLDPAKRQYSGWLDCLRKTVRADGIAGLYRGLAPCMLRAAPVNAATFAAYELAMRVLDPSR